MVHTWISRFEIRLVSWNKIIRDKKSKRFVKNQSFKDFTTNRKERNWTIIFFVWSGIMYPFFPFRRKNASKKSLSKNYLKWFIDWVTTIKINIEFSYIYPFNGMYFIQLYWLYKRHSTVFHNTDVTSMNMQTLLW